MSLHPEASYPIPEDTQRVAVYLHPAAHYHRQIRPQLPRTLVTAIPHMEGNDLPCLFVHGNPHPWLMRFCRHDAPHLIRFHLQTPADHFPGSHDRQHMEMSRQGRKAGDEKVHQPPETDAHCTTDAMEGDVLAESAFDHRTLVFTNRAVFGV